MTMRFNKAFLLTVCLTLSVLVHILFFYAWLISGTYDFSPPVTPAQWVEVDLARQTGTAPVPEKQEDVDDTDQAEQDFEPEADPSLEHAAPPSEAPAPAVADAEKLRPAFTRQNVAVAAPPTGSPLSADKFLTSKYEKLTYLISMYGIPVGNAELEAKNVNSEVWLTLTVRSNSAISNFYHVDNLVETRHIDGKFIMAKIRQKEGSFKSDEWFTINLRKKKVTWFDNLGGRSETVTVPTEDVFDTLSGIYFLRNRQLQVGKTETLHIFDSESYADVPVEILRRETVRLPNLATVDTLVVQPLQKTAGIFRRTGDIQIWMTDDANKVPVKIVTSVSLGTVTVELVSAESKAPEEKTLAK